MAHSTIHDPDTTRRRIQHSTAHRTHNSGVAMHTAQHPAQHHIWHSPHQGTTQHKLIPGTCTPWHTQRGTAQHTTLHVQCPAQSMAHHTLHTADSTQHIADSTWHTAHCTRLAQGMATQYTPWHTGHGTWCVTHHCAWHTPQRSPSRTLYCMHTAHGTAWFMTWHAVRHTVQHTAHSTVQAHSTAYATAHSTTHIARQG